MLEAPTDRWPYEGVQDSQTDFETGPRGNNNPCFTLNERIAFYGVNFSGRKGPLHEVVGYKEDLSAIIQEGIVKGSPYAKIVQTTKSVLEIDELITSQFLECTEDGPTIVEYQIGHVSPFWSVVARPRRLSDQHGIMVGLFGKDFPWKTPLEEIVRIHGDRPVLTQLNNSKVLLQEGDLVIDAGGNLCYQSLGKDPQSNMWRHAYFNGPARAQVTLGWSKEFAAKAGL